MYANIFSRFLIFQNLPSLTLLPMSCKCICKLTILPLFVPISLTSLSLSSLLGFCWIFLPLTLNEMSHSIDVRKEVEIMLSNSIANRLFILLLRIALIISEILILYNIKLQNRPASLT